MTDSSDSYESGSASIPQQGVSRRQALPLFGAVALAGVAPTMMAGAPAAASTRPSTHASERLVYVGTYTTGSSTSEGIYVYRMDRNGQLSPAQVISGIPNPSWLTLHPQEHALYATSEVGNWNGESSGGVTAFSVDPSTGELSKLNDRPTEGIAVHSAVDHSERYLLAANYAGASFAVLSLQADGRLGSMTDVFPVSGQGPVPDRQTEPHPHQVLFDPAGRYVFGVDLGTDKVWAWHLDDEGSDGGTLKANDLPYLQVASGSGARHLAFHPSRPFVYVINELSSSITAFRYDGKRGTFRWVQSVSTLPADFTGENYPAEIAVHPGGRFLYGSNRGHDSVAIFAVDQETGMLSAVGWESTQGKWPRNFTIDPLGETLLVANQNSDNIVAFRIRRGGGKLEPTGAVTSVPSPVCIAYGGVAAPRT